MSFLVVTENLANTKRFVNHVDPALPFRSARAIRDPVIMAFLDEFDKQNQLLTSLDGDNCRTAFLERFPSWLLSSSCNRLTNLSAHKHISYTHGSIQAFDAFYFKHNMRRLRCFKGEFMYHKASRLSSSAFAYIENAPIATSDAVIISYPFSDSGGMHPLMHEIIFQCNMLNVPVMIDCAYMNIGIGMEFDFDQPCIECVVFSLSKTFFGVDKMRIGVRFSRKYADDFIDIMNTSGLVNQYSCAVGLALISTFIADYNQMKYRQRQLNACRSLAIEPSECVIFGLGGDKWKDYSRGGASNRLCINSLIEAEAEHYQ